MKHIRKFNESMEKDDLLLKSVEITKDITPLKAGIKIEFKKPICFIVGDNGVGKSTILECIADYYGHEDDTYMKRQGGKSNIKIEESDEKFPFKYIDFHGDDKKYASAFGSDMSLQVSQMRASSGQVSIGLLNNALRDPEKLRGSLIILDEPCRGQSIKNKIRLSMLISGLSKKLDCQLIITTHSESILKTFKDDAQFFDIVKNEDTSYHEYMIAQLS